MMEQKAKYMPIWGRYVNIFNKLPNERLGELFRAMMLYYFEDTQPQLPETLSMSWDFLQQDMDHARESYQKKVESGRKGGKRSGEVRRETKETEAQESEIEETQQITRTESESKSRTKSKTRSESKIEIGSAPASAGAGLSSEKKSYGEFGWVKLTDHQYRQLQAQMGEQTLRACIGYIDRSAQSTGNRNRWQDWYLLIRRCNEEGWHIQRQTGYARAAPVPTGASGHLGEEELEAIRRVLAEY